jgi:simple sugar transport system ATP-binding protein
VTTAGDGVRSKVVLRPKVAIAGHHMAKSFGHVNALTDANVTVESGKVVALLGDNGAGKSTFLKCLLGIEKPSSGTLVIADQETTLDTVRDAQRLGVDCIHQDLALAPALSVVDNMFLGHQVRHRGVRGRLGVVARREMSERAAAALEELSIRLPSLSVPVSDLSGGQRQAVAVARAVMWSSTAVLMDEPTAALGARQSEIVCELMRTVAARGLGVLVVSHDLPRVLKVADRVAILWRGETVVETEAAGLTVPDVVATMVGYRKAVA